MAAPSQNGAFVISLDFELAWGMRDSLTFDAYRTHLENEYRVVIPQMLNLFKQKKIHATWATVGFLFFSDKSTLKASFPDILPQYQNKRLSPYLYFDSEVGLNDVEDPLHFAPQLISMIRNTPNQEISTHTYSHYYCLAPGQTIDTFNADLKKAIDVAAHYGLPTTSIVFPRNEVNFDYLGLCAQLGLVCYRGNQPHWLYQKSTRVFLERLKRVGRFLDSYLSLSGIFTYPRPLAADSGLLNIPASLFFRAYRPGKWWQALKLRRIKQGMKQAALRGEIYHLWWHPHNLGGHPKEALEELTHILDFYTYLHDTYGLQSLSMTEAAQQWA